MVYSWSTSEMARLGVGFDFKNQQILLPSKADGAPTLARSAGV